MQIFILDPEHNSLMAKLTQQSISSIAPAFRTQIIEGPAGERLNMELTCTSSPYFITLMAGERITPGFQAELEQSLTALNDYEAGICMLRVPSLHRLVVRESIAPRGPAIWRKKAALDAGGFSNKDWLPFDAYILLDLMYRVSPNWTWKEFTFSTIQISVYPQMRIWRKEKEEWMRIRPLLAGTSNCKLALDPIFTIALSTYNAAETLLWSIRSVLTQTFTAWELIIVDDGSDDHTAEKLKQLPPDDRIIILNNEENRGKARCLNQITSFARGKWLLELDADDWLSSDCLAILAASIDNGADGAVFYANHEEWLERSDRYLLYVRSVSSIEDFSPTRLLDEASPLAPRLYLIDALRSIGGWCESGLYDGRLYEDFQILIRLSKRYRIQHLPYPLYHRRIRSTSITQSNQQHYEHWKQWFLMTLEVPDSLRKNTDKIDTRVQDMNLT